MGRNLYPCRLPGGCAHEMMFALHLYDSRRTAGQQAEKTKRGQGPRSGARSRGERPGAIAQYFMFWAQYASIWRTSASGSGT